MTAEFLEPVGPRDPGDDPAAIFELLPESHRPQFRAEDDQGMLTFVVHDQTETLRIVDILWVG